MVLAVSGGIYMTVMSPKYPGTLSRAHAVLGFTLLSAAVIQASPIQCLTMNTHTRTHTYTHTHDRKARSLHARLAASRS